MAILSYREGLELVESYVKTYSIYVLRNPINNEVFYVGKTSKELKVRLSGHMSDLGSESAKGQYLKQLFDKGHKPSIEAVEVLYGTCYIDSIKALDREIYWIKHFKSNGCNLTNSSSMSEDACNLEFKRYINQINSGKALWEYYYCGKTKYGAMVYDEEKLNDDGFVLNINKEEMRPDFKGLSDEDFKESITYHNVYDDENPNYIVASYEEI